MKLKRMSLSVFLFPLALLAETSAAAVVDLAGNLLINPGIRDTAYTSGSYFAMGANDPNGNAVMLQPGSAGGIVLGTHQNFVLNPDVPHPYNWDGKGAGAGTGYSGVPTTASTLLLPFSFFGTPTYVGTNPVSYQSGLSHPVASATLDTAACGGTVCTLNIELSAWEVMWNGSAFEQGPRPVATGPFVPAVGTLDLSNNFYSVTWASQINGGPFSGVTGYWHLEGTFVPVPIPASLWLFVSGFGLLLSRHLRFSTSTKS